MVQKSVVCSLDTDLIVYFNIFSYLYFHVVPSSLGPKFSFVVLMYVSKLPSNPLVLLWQGIMINYIPTYILQLAYIK